MAKPFVPRVMTVASIALIATTTVRSSDTSALHLYQLVETSDVIVIARAIDAERAIAMVERVVKGHPGGQIRLVRFIDTQAVKEQRQPLVRGSRELMFLRPVPGGYAPVATQLGRWPIGRDGRFENRPWHTVDDAIASIRRLHDLQRKAGRSEDVADLAYTTALRSSDPDVRLWALHSVVEGVDRPSPQLLDAYFALWRSGDPEAWGSIANAVIAWRLGSAAHWLTDSLGTSGDYRQRANAARALGGTGDREVLTELRRAAESDASPHVRASAYAGLTGLLGPESLPDLRKGTADPDEVVRSRVAWEALNLARGARDAGVRSDVKVLLESLKADASTRVSGNAQDRLLELERMK